MSDDRTIDLNIEQVKHLAAGELSEDQMALIRSSLERYSGYQQSMAEFPLENSDEPDTVFTVYREEERS